MSRILCSGIVSVLFVFMSTGSVASTTMQASDLEKVEKKQIQSASERETMEQVAVTLASYEFAAAKLVTWSMKTACATVSTGRPDN